MNPNEPVTAGRRNGWLYVLAIIFAVLVLFLLMIITGWVFAAVVAIAAGILAVGLVHYWVWGRAAGGG